MHFSSKVLFSRTSTDKIFALVVSFHDNELFAMLWLICENGVVWIDFFHCINH